MYEKERQDGVPCRNTACEYWARAFDQYCGAEYEGGSPAVVNCENYEPEGLDEAMG